MPQMLTLSNGRPETILSPKDFEDLIDKHMGMDCANYYQNQIEQLSELIRDLDSYVDDNKTVVSSRFDSSEFKKEYPDLFTEYSRETSYKRFCVL